MWRPRTPGKERGLFSLSSRYHGKESPGRDGKPWASRERALEHRHDEDAFDYGRDRGNIFAAFHRKCPGAAWRRRDGGVGGEPWSAVRSGWSRAAWSAIRPGRQLLRAGASEGTGIIAMSIIADIRRDNPALRGFA